MSFKFKLIALLFIITFLICFQNVEAIGLAHGSLSHNFEPGGEIIVSFRVVAYSDLDSVEVDMVGDLVEYATMTEMNEQKRFWVTINLPNSLTPGMHYLNVSAFEKKPEGYIGVATKVVNPIKVFVPYEGKYLRINSFSVDYGSVNEPINLSINVENLGTNVIDSISADIDIYDNLTNELITTLSTDTISLESTHGGTIRTTWSGIDERGIYIANATVNFDGKSTNKEAIFRVGEMLVEIFGFSDKIVNTDTSPFSITVESKWNSKIKDVYASVYINNTEFRSYPADLPPWEEINVTAYLDVSDLEVGQKYPVNVTVYYDGHTNFKEGEVEIVSKGFAFTGDSVYILIGVILLIAIYFLHKRNIKKPMRKKK